MNYKFVNAPISGMPKLVMDFSGKYSILTNIFNELVLDYDNKNDWLEGISNTILGKLENGDFGVPGFGADVGKEKTIIYCDFTDEEVEISTEEFKKLSEIWFDKLEQFNRTGNID
ncbi:hypothetical protein [Clostridium tetani]|uniref:hypothetical protein n=1 Tax=Clostridium tetani TaxID=1513 RepID=UPI001026F1DA|nr:hypothetical protein [Clostridium tetani]RXI72126.1 hypothetical protein DP127_07645 [Clostridium tetani]BDR75265.1 hypothetical protein K154306013_09250 [Clostridium tetani]